MTQITVGMASAVSWTLVQPLDKSTIEVNDTGEWFKVRDDVQDWLELHCKDRWCVPITARHISIELLEHEPIHGQMSSGETTYYAEVFAFENPKDAMLFKLTWA